MVLKRQFELNICTYCYYFVSPDGSSSHLVMDGHMSRVFAVQYTPGDDNVFLSGGWDDTVQVW